jgi:cytochrome c oxidase cbb3-type subunit 3
MPAPWTIYILLLTVLTVVGCAWLMVASDKMETGEGETTGHRWDGDIVEGNNPLPRWWLGLFWLTIVFGVGYLTMFPGIGGFGGVLGWSQEKQYDEEVARAEQTYGALFAAFAEQPIEELAEDPAALSAGRNLFENNCAACHGSDARGARDFPDLTDNEWLWGGDPQSIFTTIMNGRTGAMPPFGAVLDEATVGLMADYVLHLSGREMSEERAAAAAGKYATYCAACHGPDGRGSQVMGAPPFANEVWLHGASPEILRGIITNGVTNVMPAQGPLLGEDRVRVLAAYVYSLSRSTEDGQLH